MDSTHGVISIIRGSIDQILAKIAGAFWRELLGELASPALHCALI
jgi:hypothetical protein